MSEARFSRMIQTATLVALTACGDGRCGHRHDGDTDTRPDETVDTSEPVQEVAPDADEDGFDADEDCDDRDAAINPGAEEIPYNGVDEDCDDGDLVDQDHDGYDDTKRDGDSDGLTDAIEFQIGTNAYDWDSDGDDISDYDEDSDGDGLTDGEEVDETRTDPLEADTDSGGVEDGAEVSVHTDPLNSADDEAARAALVSELVSGSERPISLRPGEVVILTAPSTLLEDSYDTGR